MEQPSIYNYSWVDFVFSVIGVFTFFVDWGADVWVATEFYRRGDFFWFGVLVGLMVLSSVLVQMFSWFWLQYDRGLPDLQTGGGTVLFGDRLRLSCLLHVLQLGFLCRGQGVGVRVWFRRFPSPLLCLGPAAHLCHPPGLPGVVAQRGGLRIRLLPEPRPEHAAADRDLLGERPPAHPDDLRHAAHPAGPGRPVCERRRVHHLHRLDGGGLPPLPALLPAGQGQAGLGVFPHLLPVEPSADRAPRGGAGPLRLRGGGLPGPPPAAAVAGLCHLGLAAEDPLHGQPGWRVALPGHRGHHLVLQLVQRGRGSDQGQERHLPRLHHRRRRHSAGDLVVLPGAGPGGALRPGAAPHAAPLLPPWAALQKPLLLLLPPHAVEAPSQRAGAARRPARRRRDL
ncbi:unnamed protein product [Tetraodon nigroviridis]|nr:unnamed protein product [Tetraodon nigroviridis]